jgi:peptidyl-prolyl cis-trans isomerase D
MGTFERIRKTSPIVLAAVAVLLVAYFVISDANLNEAFKNGANSKNAVVISINKEEIMRNTYENKIQQQEELVADQFKKQNMPVDQAQIRRTVWAKMIDETLLHQEAEKNGITVSAEEIRDIMLTHSPDDLARVQKVPVELIRKMFDFEAFRINLARMAYDSTNTFVGGMYFEVLKDVKKLRSALPNELGEENKSALIFLFSRAVKEIEDVIVETRLTESLKSLVSSAGSIISPSFAKMKLAQEKSTADVAYISFDLNMGEDNSIKVSDEEIKKYYEENKSFMEQKAKRKVKVAVIPLKPSQQDSANATKRIQKIQEDLAGAGTFANMDTVFTRKVQEARGEVKSDVYDYKNVNDIDATKLTTLAGLKEREILGPLMLRDTVYFFRLDGKREGVNPVVKASHILIGFGDGSNKDSAKALAMSVLSEAKKGGDFAELAKKNSSDPGSAQNGGDLGFFGKGKMIKEFDSAAFSVKVGGISDIVETQFGYHIIKVVDKKTDEYKWSELRVTPLLSRTTMNQITDNANEIKQLADKGTKFDEACTKFGIQARETPFITNDRPIMGSNYLTALIFKAEVGKVVQPMEIKNQGLVIVQVLEDRKEGITPLQDVKDLIKTMLATSKKLDMLKEKAQAVYAKIASAPSLDAVASIDPSIIVKKAEKMANNGSVAGLGNCFVFSNAAFTLPLNKISELIRGEAGYYIMSVMNRNPYPEAHVENELKDYYSFLSSQARENHYYQLLSKVRETAKIDDKRSEFYTEY